MAHKNNLCIIQIYSYYLASFTSRNVLSLWLQNNAIHTGNRTFLEPSFCGEFFGVLQIEIKTLFKIWHHKMGRAKHRSTRWLPLCPMSLTKLVHFARTKLSLGNRCIDIPGVFELFLQLTLSGPPATQYFPRDFPFARLFWVSAMTIAFRMNARVQPVTSYR